MRNFICSIIMLFLFLTVPGISENDRQPNPKREKDLLVADQIIL